MYNYSIICSIKSNNEEFQQEDNISSDGGMQTLHQIMFDGLVEMAKVLVPDQKAKDRITKISSKINEKYKKCDHWILKHFNFKFDAEVDFREIILPLIRKNYPEAKWVYCSMEPDHGKE